jgi:filamentous hemagglutinin family protein
MAHTSRGRPDGHPPAFYRASQGPRSTLKPLVLAIATVFIITASGSGRAQTLPAGANVASGSAGISTAGKQMTVDNSPGAILNWQSFSIGATYGVHFQQQNSLSQVLNRVVGKDPSQIVGSLTSNGRVWLINPSGILFGQNARVDVAGLVASTRNISDGDFLAQRFNFSGSSSPGEILNQGNIATPFGGSVYLIGGSVRNEGLIRAPGGEIVLAAGESVELVDSGTPNLAVRVTAGGGEAKNLGSLISEGGRIDVHAATVNQEGIVRADSASADSHGRIVLKASQGMMLSETSQISAAGGSAHLQAGAEVNNRGEISGNDVAITASDILQQGQITAPGGRMTMSAGTSTYLDGSVDVSNPLGTGGSIWLTTGKLEGMAGGSLRADGLMGGQIHVEGRGLVAFSSTVSATGAIQGGTVEVTGDSVYLLNADIDASGISQGGIVHLGGGWHGEGGLPHAREVFVGVGSEVWTNGPLGTGAGPGTGGELVVWSTDSSENYGSLRALDGGRIEFSSLGQIRPGDLQAGPGGSVLFDPKNLIVTDNPPDSLTLARKVVSGSVDGTNPTLGNGDNFGSSIALDGDRMAVGAPLADTGGDASGEVHLFTGVGTNYSGLTWQTKLASGTGATGMPSLGAGSHFGTAVALDGDRLAVGANFEDVTEGNDNTGAVHVFAGVGTNFANLTWQNRITSGNEAVGMPPLDSGAGFGDAVALDGDRLAIGAFRSDAVHLFTGVGTDFSGLVWRKQLASGVGMPSFPAGDGFGGGIALDGDRLAVGAPFANGFNGVVYLFTGVGSDFTNLVFSKTLSSANPAFGMPALGSDAFGGALALDGDLLAVGAVLDDTGGANRGAVHFFNGVGADFSELTWMKRLASGSGASGMPALADTDLFGASVALDGGRLAIGAVQDDAGDRGAVYLFTGLSTLGAGVIGASGATFSTNPGGTSYITPRTITTLLDAGTAVTLEANNDITLLSPVSTSGDLASLTLRAGRNIGIFAGINLGNGDLTAVAGDPGADQAFRDPGTPTLTLGDGNMTLYIGGVGTLAAVDGAFVSNGAGLGKTEGLGRWLIYASDPTTSSNYLDNKHYDQSFSLGTVPAYAATGDWQFYSVAPVLSVTPSSQSSTYGNALPAFTPSLAGFIDGDTANTAGIGGAAGWNVAGATSTSGNLTAGTHDVSYAGGLASSLGYHFADNAASSNELSVDPKTLTAAYSGHNKVYDGTTAATVTGSSPDIVAGDKVGFSQNAAFRDDPVGTGKNVGTAKIIDVTDIALGGIDASNYTLQNNTATTTADIAAKALSVGLTGSVAKVFDTTVDVALTSSNFRVDGIVAGDAVSVATPAQGRFDTPNVGSNKQVFASGIGISGGEDAQNYMLASTSAVANIGSVTPATLSYQADRASVIRGQPMPLLSGSVTGFQGSDTITTATSGTLSWETLATSNSNPGTYSIFGQGLAASNYNFVQASSNATALAVLSPTSLTDAVQDSVLSINNVIPSLLEPVLVATTAGRGGLIDATASAPPGLASAPGSLAFAPINISGLSRASILALLAERHEIKKKIFADAIYKLIEDPSLAEIKPCASLADVASGTCMMTAGQREQLAGKPVPTTHEAQRNIRIAVLPQIDRKLAVLIGINDYQDRTIPPLENAIPDVEVVAKLFEEELGYETRVIRNPTKAGIIMALNQLSAEIDPNDSVVIYYAGHGYLIDETGVGYWLPSDAPVNDPTKWISNSDVTKFLANIHSNQLVMISDSCYSGAFTREQKLTPGGSAARPDEILTHRSVVVMSSGGDEPVADEGKEGHSVFAWNLMQVLKNVSTWQQGTTVFEEVQTRVSKEFPQTPQYGAALSAGHQAGGDYLFEFRQLQSAEGSTR